MTIDHDLLINHPNKSEWLGRKTYKWYLDLLRRIT